MSPVTVAVGKEIRTACTTCKKPQIHVITALSEKRIDTVQCKVCGKSHRYRLPTTTAAAKRRRQEAAEVIPPEVIWKKLMAATATKKTIPYSFDKQYQVNDLISHETFGLGVVTKLPTADKARVAFKERELLLVCNR